MEIKVTEKGTKDYYNEFLYMAYNYKSFRNNPFKKTHNISFIVFIYIAILAICTICFYQFYKITLDNQFLVEAGMLIVLEMVLIVIYIIIQMQINNFMNISGDRKIKISQKGLEYVDDIQNLRISWDDIKNIIINQYSITVVPNSKNRAFMAISKTYKEEFIKGLEKFDKTSLLVDNGSHYK